MEIVQKAAEKPACSEELDAKPSSLPVFASRRILGMRVDCATYASAVEAIVAMAREAVGGSVCIATVHMVMETRDDPKVAAAVEQARLVTSDGMPLVWALRALGLGQAERVYGPSLMPHVCRRAAELGLRIGLYGGSEQVLSELRMKLVEQHSGLEIAFAHSPPFRALGAGEDAEIVRAIADAGVDVLFVGLGCPKQETWMAEHAGRLSCPAIGVGAAFDFIAGAKSQAPGWMQASGLEWLYRLACEPRRLWHRYLYNNPRFVVGFLVQWMRERGASHLSKGRMNS